MDVFLWLRYFPVPSMGGNRFFEVEVNLRRKTTQTRIVGGNSFDNWIDLVHLYSIKICEASFYQRLLSTSKAERTCLHPKQSSGSSRFKSPIQHSVYIFLRNWRRHSLRKSCNNLSLKIIHSKLPSVTLYRQDSSWLQDDHVDCFYFMTLYRGKGTADSGNFGLK